MNLNSKNGTKLLRDWDVASRSKRDLMLIKFCDKFKERTAPQIEKELGNIASLFLTRISAYLRLTYTLKQSLTPQLQALALFLTAPSAHTFLQEFVHSGCVPTLLDILKLKELIETDKHIVFQIIIAIENSGRKFKELLCEVGSIDAIIECLSWNDDGTSLSFGRTIFYNLSVGNPKYSKSIQQKLLSTLEEQKDSSSALIYTIGQSLRLILSQSPPDKSFISPVFCMLACRDIRAQFEGFELLKLIALANMDLAELIIEHAIKLLMPPELVFDENNTENNHGNDNNNDANNHNRKKSMAVSLLENNGPSSSSAHNHISESFILQASAARLLGILASTRIPKTTTTTTTTNPCHEDEFGRMIVKFDGVGSLILTMANAKLLDGQKNAASSLAILIRMFPLVEDAVRKHFGIDLYDNFIASPEEFNDSLTQTWSDIMKTGIPHIEGMQDPFDQKRRRINNNNNHHHHHLHRHQSLGTKSKSKASLASSPSINSSSSLSLSLKGATNLNGTDDDGENEDKIEGNDENNVENVVIASSSFQKRVSVFRDL